ncbi:MAG: DUF2085 domain-containing protein [Chloroflexi bacterium]|nr:DUF2085 domain-containing protein [Chloroflexota bacterium]
MLNVTLFTRKDCSPCKEVKQELDRLQEKYPHRLVEVDIDSDDVLRAKYGTQVPVLEAGPYTLKAPITSQSLQMTLGAAIDRKTQLEQVGDKEYQTRLAKGQRVSFGDRFSFWIAKKYLLYLNLFILFYGGLPFLAPVFLNAGMEFPAKAIYRIYKPLCHQFGFRSFFLFGEQTFYPLEEAGLTGLKTFEQVSGIPDVDNPFSSTRLAARQYVGDESVGFKVALCERDVAIYASILTFGLLFVASGRRIKPLHWMIWLAIGLTPISLDGFSQLFSQFNWDWLASIVPYRESTPFLRILTGALFGFTTA